MLEIRHIRGAKTEEIISKKYRLYMGISLGNKWFVKENIKQYILWGIKFSKDKFCVQIADKLQAINYEARGNYSKQAAIRKALREGDNFELIVKEIIKDLPEKERDRVDICRWSDIEKDEIYQKVLEVFNNKFKQDRSFNLEIKKIVADLFINKQHKKISDKELEHLCLYVISEMPELINGFSFNGLKYDGWIYPYDGDLMSLVENIQKGEKYSELHKETTIGNNIFVEIR